MKSSLVMSIPILLMDILNWNRLNGNLSRNPDGSLSNLPKEVTWK